MTTYAIPEIQAPQKVAANEVLLVANGDLRQSANEVCCPHRVGQNGADRGEHVVAAPVAVLIVDVLEVIEVAHQGGERCNRSR